MKSQPGFMPNLSNIGLDDFKDELKTGRLLPGRKLLLKDIDEEFSRIQKAGIKNLGELRNELKNCKKISRLAKETGIPEDYLKVLKREVNSLLPTPVKFGNIPNISEEIVNQLHALNITDTRDLFPYVKNPDNRQKFKQLSGFSLEDILWLTKIVDVSRIKWVGPKLARLIVDTQYDTVQKLSGADPQKVLMAFNKAKKKHKAYEGALGMEDIESWIKQVVLKTPLIIEY